jgi:hypothetical protein
MTPSTTHAQQRMAVFVDIENVAGYCGYLGAPVDIAPVLAQLAQLARPIFRRSFGDISALPRPFQPYEVRRMLQQNQIMHEDIPHRPSSYSKNSADIRLVVEAVALAHQRPDLTHFAIFSNDRDFIPLFNHLRELGKVVIGCGPSRSMVNEDYLNACDLFMFHDEIVVIPLAVPVVPAAAVGATTPPPADPASAATSAPTAPGAPLPTTKLDTTPAEVATIPNDVERLLAAIQSVQAESLDPMASLVAGRMKKLYPEFDAKLLFGSFKRFCLVQAETGKVRLENADQPTFLILPDDGLTPRPATTQGNAPSLLELYRQWIQRKMRITMPTPQVREQLYAALVAELAARPNEAPISLKELADRAGEGPPERKNVAFRIFYGLFRSRALHCMLTEDAFNPTILGLKVAPDQLDSYFSANTQNSFHHDASGLPFDEAVWSVLMNGEPALAEAETMPDLPEVPEANTVAPERPSREETFWLRYPKKEAKPPEAEPPVPFSEEAQQLLNL